MKTPHQKKEDAAAYWGALSRQGEIITRQRAAEQTEVKAARDETKEEAPRLKL